MSVSLTRPPPRFGPGDGLVRNEHFQIAYAVTDMDHALEIFARDFGVKKTAKLEGPTPEGGHIRMEIGWAGGTMYELVCATGAGGEIFRTGLPAEGFAMRVHHLGYLVPSAEAWDDVLREIRGGTRKIVRETKIAGFLQAVIIEAPELGHYLEYIFPEASGLAFFENAPNN